MTMLQGCTPLPADVARRYRAAGVWRDQTIGEVLDEPSARSASRLRP